MATSSASWLLKNEKPMGVVRIRPRFWRTSASALELCKSSMPKVWRLAWMATL
ncbi:hypothetical protein D3C78_1827000 [compost metagenome]